MWMDANVLQEVESNMHLDTQAQMMCCVVGLVNVFLLFPNRAEPVVIVFNKERCERFASLSGDGQYV